MENYITQLLTDIENAHRPELPLETDDDGSQTIAAVEKWLAQQDEPKHTFSYYCGLQREQFPPVDRLNPSQIDSLVEAFEYLLSSWNMSASMPEEVPSAIKYELLAGILDKEVDIVDRGIIGIEFCHYDPNECPFGSEYCTCKDYN
jgi:hypothetical protein